MKPFVFVGSFPKSGSTWVRSFLAAYINGGTVNINNLPTRVAYSDLMPSFYHSLAPVPINTLTHYGVLALRNNVLQHISYFGGEWPIYLKTHHANVAMNGFQLIPEPVTEKAIYLVRDPRDVAISLSKHNNEDLDQVIENMGNERCILHSKIEHESSLFHLLSSWSYHVDSWMKSSFTCEAFTYEKLVQGPEDGFKRLLEFLEFEFDKRVFEMALESTKFESLKAQEEKDGFREAANGKFFNSGKVGGWKDVLTDDQRAKIEYDHFPVMQKLGYL